MKNKIFSWVLFGLFILVCLYLNYQITVWFYRRQFNKFIENETFAAYYFVEPKTVEYEDEKFDMGFVVGEVKAGRCFKDD